MNMLRKIIEIMTQRHSLCCIIYKQTSQLKVAKQRLMNIKKIITLWVIK